MSDDVMIVSATEFRNGHNLGRVRYGAVLTDDGGGDGFVRNVSDAPFEGLQSGAMPAVNWAGVPSPKKKSRGRAKTGAG